MTTHVLERRSVTSTVEYRAAEDGKGPVAVGYAAVFDRRSLELRDRNKRVFVETIDPGAFTKTLQESDVLALWNHDHNSLLGRVSSGTLRLAVDKRGLRYEVDLPDTSTGRDVAELLRRGDIRGSSFGFRTIQEDWSEDDEGTLQRRLIEAALIDTSPVTAPAYPDTDAGLRSVAAAVGHDLTEVRAAFEQRRLGSLVFPAGEPEIPPTEPEGERRAEPTFAHRRLSWAY